MIKKEELKVLRQSWYDEARKQTNETIPSFLQKLFEYNHDYNTICYACGAAAVAAATAIDNHSITGFQANAIMWEFVTEWLQEQDKPMRLVKFENMLYPQYKSDFDKTILQETADWLISKAKEKLELYTDLAAHPDVLAHWKSLAKGELPFGYRIVKEN
jgi:hypothetical protein